MDRIQEAGRDAESAMCSTNDARSETTSPNHEASQDAPDSVELITAMVRAVVRLSMDASPNETVSKRRTATLEACEQMLLHADMSLQANILREARTVLEQKRTAFVDLPRWRVYRKHGRRLLTALTIAANRLYRGPAPICHLTTSMLAKSGLNMVADLTPAIVVQWLLRTGIAVRSSHGRLASGPLCKLYADELWTELGLD